MIVAMLFMSYRLFVFNCLVFPFVFWVFWGRLFQNTT